MSEIKLEELVPSRIYVTHGGQVTVHHTDKETKQLTWGYDRVRFIKLEDDYIIVETPWNTNCSLLKTYLLQSTSETVMRCEFPMRGVHISREIISFDNALEMGLCKEVTASELKVAADPTTITQHRSGAISKNLFTESLIEYFSEAKTVSSAAERFGVKYQKIRYTIKNLKDKGYGVQRFTVVISKQNGLSTVKLEKVSK